MTAGADPKGNIVMETFEREGRTEALIFRPDAVQKYVVAHGYDAETGEWGHGSYFSDPMRAYAEANPEILEESLVVWEKDDIRAALEREGAADGEIEDATREAVKEGDGMKEWRARAVREGDALIRSAARDALAAARAERQPIAERIADAVEGSRAAEAGRGNGGGTPPPAANRVREDGGGWHERCEAFKADPESLKEWHREANARITAAADWIPCWGDAYCIDEAGRCVSAAEFEEVLPTRAEQELYFALEHAEAASFDDVLACCEDVTADLELGAVLEEAAEREGVGLAEIDPSDFDQADLAALAAERPDLFDDASCAKWPELARAKEAAALDSKLGAISKSSKTLDAEKRGGEKPSPQLEARDGSGGDARD